RAVVRHRVQAGRGAQVYPSRGSAARAGADRGHDRGSRHADESRRDRRGGARAVAHDLDRQTALEIRLAIEDLNTDFNHYLDHGDIDKLLDLFTDDVYYTHGDRRSNGRHELEQVFRR